MDKKTEEIAQILSQHTGERALIKYMNGDKVSYADGVISNEIGIWVGIWEAANDMLSMNGIPVSTISLITKSRFWWKDYHPGSEEVLYGTEEEIQAELDRIVGRPGKKR